MTKKIAVLATTIVLLLPGAAGAHESPYGKGKTLGQQLRYQITHKHAQRAPVAIVARSSWS